MSQDLFEGLEPEQPIRSSVASEAASRAALLLNKLAPLAERMRPKTIDEVIGQKKLLGPGQPLRVAFETHRPHSMILWGPPGVGKTTLARLMADAFGLPFLSALRVHREQSLMPSAEGVLRCGSSRYFFLPLR